MAAFGHYPDLEAGFSGQLCRSLRARGQLSAADFEEQRVLAKNGLARRDLALLQARDKLEQAIAARPLAESTRIYDDLVDTMGRGAGIDFYDQIVNVFVQHLVQLGRTTEARQAADRARAMLYVPSGSQLDGEFDKLFKDLRSLRAPASR